MNSRIEWEKFPFLRYTLALIIGILIYHESPILTQDQSYFNSITLVIVLVFCIGSFLFKSGFLASFAPWIFFVLCGFYISHINDPLRNPVHISYSNQEEEALFIAQIHNNPVFEDSLIKCELKLIEFSDGVYKSVSGTVIANIVDSNKENKPGFGDILSFKSIIRKIRDPVNPYGFNYKEYLATKDIFHQTYIKEGYKIIGHSEFGFIWKSAYDLKNYLISKFKEIIDDPQVLMFAKALVLGDKSDLDSTLKDKFSKTGVIHVLAVSGLHVGILYGLILAALRVFKGLKYYELIKFIFTIISLFSFALITGFSPSVSRSVLMFSLFSLSELLNRKSATYNTIFLSAFLILMVNPKMIYNLGFQLSYSAVLGIVYFYPKMVFNSGYSFFNRVIQMSSVSISATISTLPLTLFYFHQFPVIFIFSNLLVIPIITISLILYLALIILSFSDILLGLINEVLNVLNSLMIMIIEYLNELSFSLIENIFYDHKYLIISILLLIFTVLAIEFRFKTHIYVICFLLILGASYSAFLKIGWLRNERLIFLADKRFDSPIVIKGRKMIINQEFENPELIQSRIKPYLSQYGIKQVVIVEVQAIDKNQSRMWALSSDIVFCPRNAQSSIESADWVFINNQENPDQIIDRINPIKGFLLGNNIPFFIKKRLVSKLNQRGIDYYDLQDHGDLELM